jgi:hypothetical protein
MGQLVKRYLAHMHDNELHDKALLKRQVFELMASHA